MDSEENLFVNICSKNERLIGEMNDYLASITQSPGEGTNSCKNEGEARQTDNSSQPIPTSNVGNGLRSGDSKGTTHIGGSKKNLGSIDENAGVTNPSAEYEYFNDYKMQSPSANQLDDDSLVAMAKRMDAASIISDPSLICGPREKILALPQPKQFVKKLVGQKDKPPQPPKRVQVGPATPKQQTRAKSPARKSLKINQQKNDPTASSGFMPKLKHSIVPSPASSNNESSDFRTTNAMKQNGGNRRHSSGSANLSDWYGSRRHSSGPVYSLERYDGSDGFAAPSKKSQGLQKEVAADTSVRESSSGGRMSRQRSEKSLKNRKARSLSKGGIRKSRSLSKGRRVKDDESLPSYLPDDLRPAAKPKAKSSKRGSKKHRAKKGSKKRQQKKDDDSDDDSMCGFGFNTRIRDIPKDPDDKVADQMQKQDMCGIGMNTRIRDKPKDIGGIQEEVADQLQKQTNARSTGKPPKTPKQVKVKSVKRQSKNVDRPENITKLDHSSDEDNESFHHSGSDDYDGKISGNDNSVYDSDENTQFFYESTDDEFDSDEDLVAVGTSVAQAVQDLNNKSAVAKVKNLFGIRGR